MCNLLSDIELHSLNNANYSEQTPIIILYIYTNFIDMILHTLKIIQITLYSGRWGFAEVPGDGDGNV